jgi:hypothetical protein
MARRPRISLVAPMKGRKVALGSRNAVPTQKVSIEVPCRSAASVWAPNLHG